MDMLELTTTSPDETEALGAALASLVSPGTVLALRGDLAAGKTCFVHGLARGLGTKEEVSSPTFTLVNEYAGDTTLFHVDLYRLTSLSDIMDLGYEEFFEDNEAICAVEWAERMESLLPERRIDITFTHAGKDRREITITNVGIAPEGWSQAIEEALEKVR